MKNLILVSIVLSGMSSAFAAENKVFAKLDNLDPRIESVTIEEGGLMTVTERETHLPTLKYLSSPTIERLINLTKNLDDAKIVTTEHRVVCMIRLDPRRDFLLSVSPYDHSDGQFHGERLQTILTQESCAMHLTTAPEDRSSYADAKSLKTALETLAYEALSH